MTDNPGFVTQIDGRQATADDLSPLAFAGFAHFTAMQIRDGRVRALDLHLARLRSASLEFFDRALPDELVRRHLRSAIGSGRPNLSLTATVFSRAGEFSPEGAADDPAILVRTAPPSDGPTDPLRLAVVAHERPLPWIKHVGEATKTHFLRRAVRSGHDDAAFIDAQGNLSEATIWNLAFWDGEAVVWPKAPVLAGVTMATIRRQLDGAQIAQREEVVRPDDLGRLQGAAVMNSWTPGIGVEAIGSTTLPASPRFLDILHRVYEREPMEPV